MIQTFNYLNNIPFILLYLFEKKLSFSLLTGVYLLLSFIIYDISKYFFSLISTYLIKAFGTHEYASISLCFLTLVDVTFSFIFYFNSNFLIFIIYRIFVSFFNNSSSFMPLAISILYNNKKIPNKIQLFSSMQKFSNFLLFPLIYIIVSNLTDYTTFCLFLSVLDMLGFVFYVIIFKCCRNSKYDQDYFPEISEKENRKNIRVNNLLFDKSIKLGNSLGGNEYKAKYGENDNNRSNNKISKNTKSKFK